MIVDDHFVVRLGLVGLVEQESDMEVVAQADSGVAAVEQHSVHRPDVCVIDVQMPRMNGIEAVRSIRAEVPAARFVMLSVHDREEEIHRVLDAGALAFLPKTADGPVLLDAIRAVHRGEKFMIPEVSSKLATRRSHALLTTREQEVLHHLSAGLSNKEIARVLNIAEITVKVHMGHVIDKLGVADRLQALNVARQRGLINEP
ncbi:MAG TPA: response regulator transcription factor [Chthoniobacteraceae bacterium]